MKHIGEEIHRIIESKHLVKKIVAENCGMTYANLANIKKKSTIDCQLLETICKAIDVSPSYFFDDYQENNKVGDVNTNVGIGSATVNISQGEVQMLRQMLEEKERTIQILMRAKGLEIGTETGQNM